MTTYTVTEVLRSGEDIRVIAEAPFGDGSSGTTVEIVIPLDCLAKIEAATSGDHQAADSAPPGSLG